MLPLERGVGGSSAIIPQVLSVFLGYKYLCTCQCRITSGTDNVTINGCSFTPQIEALAESELGLKVSLG